jgi:foldase protein PrsA
MQRPVAIAVVGLALALAGCGGIPGNAVVQVAGTPITKEALDHWMKVASASSSTGATEKAVLPEPPNYTACVAHLAKGTAEPAKELKSECAAQYKSLQRSALEFLISSQWVLGEASSRGVKISDAELKKEFAKIKTQQFPSASEFDRFLSTSGETVSDLLLRVKVNLLSQKIEQKIIKEHSKVTEAQIATYYKEHSSRYTTRGKHGRAGTQQPLSKAKAAIKEQLISTGEQSALSEFTKEFQKRWRAKTECRSGYVVAYCNSYKAPKTSSTSTSSPSNTAE